MYILVLYLQNNLCQNYTPLTSNISCLDYVKRLNDGCVSCCP